MGRFAGINLAQDDVADAITILAFRHVVEQHQLGEQIFKTVEQYLREYSLLLREGTIIHAPNPTKNQKRERDPEMHQTRKGNQWFFGMKVHIWSGQGLRLDPRSGHHGRQRQ